MDILIKVDIPDLADRLEKARRSRGISYGALGQKTGYTSTTVWQVLTGKNQAVKLETLMAIAEVLKVDFQEEIKQSVFMLLESHTD